MKPGGVACAGQTADSRTPDRVNARVSTEEQGIDPQLDELRAAGYTTIPQEHASGAIRSRPVLSGS